MINYLVLYGIGANTPNVELPVHSTSNEHRVPGYIRRAILKPTRNQ